MLYYIVQLNVIFWTLKNKIYIIHVKYQNYFILKIGFGGLYLKD